MRSFGIATLVLCVFMFAASSGAKERVEGAGLITEGAIIQEIVPTIMGLPFDQAEADLFLESLDSMERWATENIKAWNDIDSAEDAMAAIRALGVWKTVGITAGEYFALQTKLNTARDIHAEKYDVEGFKEQVRDIENLLKESLPEENKKQLADASKMLSKMIEAIENYPAANIEVYKANKEAIDEAFTRMNSLQLGSMISAGNTERVKELISLGVDVNSSSSSGFTPLMRAAYTGNREMVDIILKAGAQVNAKDNRGNTALKSALAKDNKDVVELLIKFGADVNDKD